MADDAHPPLERTSGSRAHPGYFQEDNGSFSAMRLMCFIALAGAVAVATAGVALAWAGKPIPDATGFFTGFLVAAFAPKAVQKFAETKVPPPAA